MKNINDTLIESNSGSFVPTSLLNNKWKNFEDSLRECYRIKKDLDDFKNDKTIEYLEAQIYNFAKNPNKDDYQKKAVIGYNKIVNELLDEFFNHNNPLIFTSRIFMEDTTYIDYLFDSNTKQRLFDARRKFGEMAKSSYEQFMNGESLFSANKRILSTYLYLKIDDESFKNIRESYYDKLVSSGANLDRYELKFVLNQASKNDWKHQSIRPEIYISDIDRNNGLSYGDSKNISISNRFINKPFIIKDEDKNFVTLNDEANIHETHGSAAVLYHEIQHQRQHEMSKKGYINLTTLYSTVSSVERQYLTTSGFDEYHCNYRHKEIENESNMIGSLKAYAECHRLGLGSDNTFRIRQGYYKSKFAKGIQKDDDGNDYSNVSYNVEMLEKIIKTHPNVYNQYPICKEFFTPYGDLKDLKTFVNQYTNISMRKSSDKNALDVYRYMLKYYLLKMNVRNYNFDLNQFNDYQDQLSLLIMLTDFVENESRSLKDFFDSIDIKSMNMRDIYVNYADVKMKVLKRAMIKIINAKQNGDIERLNALNYSKGWENRRFTKFSFVLDGRNIRTVADHVKENRLIKDDPDFMKIAEEIDDFGKQMEEHKDYYDGLAKVKEAKEKYRNIGKISSYK